MKLGASFSHPHLIGLNIDPLKAIKEFKNLGLSWIRLGCYWNEIEKEQGKFNFSKLDLLIEYCEKNNLKVVLTIGMKAPRNPEYYIPNWLLKKLHLRKLSKIKLDNKVLSDGTLKYLDKAVTHFKKNPAIKIWQVENEPLDPAGPNWLSIDSSFLEEEVRLVKSLNSKRKILINTWGNELSRRRTYIKALKLADIVGFDLYFRHPIPYMKFFKKYIGQLDSKVKIKRIVKDVKKQGKDFWIAELQAEPWEPGEIVTKKKNPPSFLPKHFETNLNYAKDLEPEVVLLWGFEYWYWKKEKGDSRYWKSAKEAIKKFQRK